MFLNAYPYNYFCFLEKFNLLVKIFCVIFVFCKCVYRSGRMRSRTRSRSRSWERDRRRSRSREHIRRDRERDRSRPWRNESPPITARRHDRRLHERFLLKWFILICILSICCNVFLYKDNFKNTFGESRVIRFSVCLFIYIDALEVVVHLQYDQGYEMAPIVAIIEHVSEIDLQPRWDLDHDQDP